MLSQIRKGDQAWNTYVFVSAKMPKSTLKNLAFDAARAKATIVFNGWPEGRSVEDLRGLVAEINKSCCEKRSASWIVNPVLFQRYKVTQTPTFIVANGEDLSDENYAVMTGNVSLSYALKFFVQNSKYPQIQRYSQRVYNTAFQADE